MDARPRIALTGATGFVGQALLPMLLAGGQSVRALARAQKNRSLTEQPGLDWIGGELTDISALQSLTAGAGVVIHLAGVTRARSAAVFDAVNAQQTAALVAAARAAGVNHFVHVSSLTASRPEVSAYARSKADSEHLAREQAGDMPLTIVRAPAILGPGDTATQPVLSLLAAGLLPIPGGRAGDFRFSMMDVLDLSRYLQALAAVSAGGHRLLTPAGHLRVGWDDLADSAARVTGRRIRKLYLPPFLMQGAGYLADFAGTISANPQVFSSGKVREMLSGDWIAETQIDAPLQLQETLARCLAPFLASGRQSGGDGRQPYGSDT
ncbi:MAG: NAD-dependent epimerase/dehydratase family protein [Hyphomonas sp.]|uniref:NAD-dependent epimerase/dehydratase family protein n=1 Tax=Hyphomonas sp. TaxID=87 RepID=UPI00349FE4C8